MPHIQILIGNPQRAQHRQANSAHSGALRTARGWDIMGRNGNGDIQLYVYIYINIYTHIHIHNHYHLNDMDVVPEHFWKTPVTHGAVLKRGILHFYRNVHETCLVSD